MLHFNKYLKKNEEIVRIIYSSKFILYLKLFFSFLIFCGPFFFMFPILSLGARGIFLSLLILSLAMVLGLKSYFYWSYNCILLGNQKIYRFYYKGLLKKTVEEFNLQSINEVSIEYHNVFLRMFKVGDLIIFLKNDKYIDLNSVCDVKKLKNRVWEMSS